MDGINHFSVLSASILILILGALWYSPLLFYKAWLKVNRFSEEDLSNQNSTKIYGVTLLLALLMCYNLAFFLNDPSTDLAWGTIAGFLTGFWAAGIFWVVSLFEQKSWKYMLINGGFMLTYFTLAGLIIGAWR